jgi:signal transduction histidine kinase
MVSGKAMVEERLEGYEAGADDYITKPFVDDELLAKLKVFSKLKKAEEIDELKTGILQLFSHETKTPLNGILLGSQLILDTPSLPDKITEYAKLIKISGERIHDLVRKILLLSSLKSSQRLALGTQPLGTYLAGLTGNNEYLPSYNIKFDLICPENFNLNVDWKLFHEAVVAVIDNGIKFTPAGGTLSIKAQCDSNFVFLHVQDQGPGIDPTLKEKIFDEFYSQQIENHSKGTALSLAISKKIMQLHGGDLCVESATEEGATFTFTLPISTLVSS